MFPVIRNGAELVIESTSHSELTINDIIAYFIESHLFVHRIRRIEPRFIVASGDNQRSPCCAVKSDDILGRISSIENPSLFERSARKINATARIINKLLPRPNHNLTGENNGIL
jgi:hypothetical protein